MNDQIKIDKLPVDGLVTDKYHQSGNKEFISYKDIYKCECDNTQWKTNKQGKKGCVQCTKWNSLNQIKLGTKHIQLVSANTNIDYPFACVHLRERNGGVYTYHVQIVEKKVGDAARQGKDFFIYKVTEKK